MTVRAWRELLQNAAFQTWHTFYNHEIIADVVTNMRPIQNQSSSIDE